MCACAWVSLSEKVETLTDSGKPSILRTKSYRLYPLVLVRKRQVYFCELGFGFALGHWTDQATRTGRCGPPVGSACEPSSQEFPHTLVMFDWGRRPRIPSCVGHARTEQGLKECLRALCLSGRSTRTGGRHSHRGAVTTHVPNMGRHNDCGCGVKCGQLLTRRRPHTGECVWGLQRGVTI